MRETMASVRDVVVDEGYPNYPKGPCVLARQNDRKGKPFHVVWGLPRGRSSLAVLVTADRPDPKRWEPDFLRKKMNTRGYTKIVHESEFVAEVDVELIYADEGWSPYLSLEDAYRLDDVREALRKGDVKSAARFGRIYTLTPVAV